MVNTGLGSIEEHARGLDVRDARNSVIANNVVSGTSETNSAYGIAVESSALIWVRGNVVLDAQGTTTRGVRILDSTDVTVIRNSILNAAGTPGTQGVLASGTSSGINCVNNLVAGFTTAFSGCDFSAGNNVAP